MLISRRSFFRISVLPALVSIAPSGLIFGQNDDLANDRLMSLRSGDFRNQIGSKFKLSEDGATAARQFVLTEVKKAEASGARQSGGGDDSDLKCFSLNFRLVGAGSVKQATYTIKHNILGNFQLFLVPGAVSASQSSLVAIINRL
jgi:hypothetical protein